MKSREPSRNLRTGRTSSRRDEERFGGWKRLELAGKGAEKTAEKVEGEKRREAAERDYE